MTTEATLKTGREAHLRGVRRRLGDDPEWNALVDCTEKAERLLDSIQKTIASHDRINEEDLRWWLDRVVERIDRERA